MFKRLFKPGTQSSLIDAAFSDVSSMLAQSENMFDLAIKALLDNQPITKADLARMDDVVDEGERMVRRTILYHLSVNPKQDLVASLVLTSMVHDAERVGDFAGALGHLVGLAEGPREGAYRDDLRKMVNEIRPMFQLCEQSFREDDPKKSRKVIKAHGLIRKKLTAFRRRVAKSDLTADMAVVYAGASHLLFRTSSHLCNIASTVVHPYDKKPSKDETFKQF